MPTIGARCHELQITDAHAIWRIVYRIDHDAIFILHVFNKETNKTPKDVIDVCRDRLRDYDSEAGEAKEVEEKSLEDRNGC
jgi:phage-related protein